jgi:predicted patatin/cPLA2 family phospholipase
MYNEQLDYLEQQEREGNILLIYPPEPLPIGRTEQNEKKMRRIYALGREMGVRRLEEIKAFLAEAKNENK